MEGFLFSKMFWGIVIILIGISVISQAVFKIHLPIGRIVTGLVFLYIGVKILLGVFGAKKEHTTIMGKSNVSVEIIEDAKYDAVFSSQVIDLSNAIDNGGVHSIECNAVFGSAKIIIPKNMRIQVKSASIFGSVRTPHNETNFGESEYTTGPNSSGLLKLKVNAVFGSVRIYED